MLRNTFCYVQVNMHFHLHEEEVSTKYVYIYRMNSHASLMDLLYLMLKQMTQLLISEQKYLVS